MKVLISIVIGLLVVGCGKKQSTNTDQSNNTPEKPSKKNEEKETPSKGDDKPPTVKSMLVIVGQPLTKDEESFAGRRKGEYQLVPDEPVTHAEAIYRKDHTCSIVYLYHVLNENGELIQGEFDRQLAHGIWKKKGDHLYFLDLVFDDEKNPEKYQEVFEAILIEAGKTKFVYKIPESKDEEGVIIPESILNEESIKKFEYPEMRAYNSADALESFDLINAYKNAKEPEPFEDGKNE